MATRKNQQKDPELTAFERLIPVVRGLARRRYSSYLGKSIGGPDAVDRVLDYLRERFGSQS